MDREIMRMAEQIKALSNVAVLQYTNIVNDILDGNTTDVQEIAYIMDGMLDFCQFNEMLLLFKRLCRGLYLKHPELGKTIFYIIEKCGMSRYLNSATDGVRI